MQSHLPKEDSVSLKVSVQDLPLDTSTFNSDRLSNKHWHSYLMAKKIRSLRQMRGLTQQQLADHVGINEAAIRNYESQKASPKLKHIEKMAEALGVRPEALRLYDMGAGDSITANVLFQIAEIYGFEPDAHLDYACLKPQNEYMRSALKEWAAQYEQFKNDAISEQDYQLWKDRYFADYDALAYPKRYRVDAEDGPVLIDNWEAHCLATKLRQLRTSHDATQSDFASFLNIKLGVYRSYEQGWRLPKASIIEQMATRLGITLGCLTFFDFGSPVQAVHALFQLSSEFGLRPDIMDGQPILRTQTPGLEQIIDQWHAALINADDDKTRFTHWRDRYEPDAPEYRLRHKTRYTESATIKGTTITCFSRLDPYNPKYRHGYLPA